MSNTLFSTGTVNTSVKVLAVLNRIHGIFNIEKGVKLIWEMVHGIFRYWLRRIHRK